MTEGSKSTPTVLGIKECESLREQNHSLADVLMAPEELDFQFDAKQAALVFKAADLD